MAPGVMLSRGVFDMTPEDILYITTPLYHSVGIMGGWGSALSTGAAIALRRRG